MSNYGGEYYIQYARSWKQCLLRFLNKYGFVLQYIKLGKPTKNDIGKRRNNTLKRYGIKYD